jgi:hypothetical protein
VVLDKIAQMKMIKFDVKQIELRGRDAMEEEDTIFDYRRKYLPTTQVFCVKEF